MKKIILAAFVMLASVVAHAQQFQFNPEDMATRQATQIKEACNVDEDQYKKLYNLFLDQSKKMIAQMDSLRNAGGGNGGFPRMDREAMQKRQDETNAKVKAILNEDQYKAYEEMLKKQRERRRQMGGGGPRQ